MAFRRLEQKMREVTVKSTVTTKYTLEFENDCRLMKAIRADLEHLAEKIAVQLKAQGDDSGAMNKWEAIGDSSNKLLQQIPGGYDGYTSSLSATTEVGRKIGSLQRQLQRDADEKVVKAIRQWLLEDGREFQKARETLEKRRLERDNAQSKAVSQSGAQASEKCEAANRAHEEQLAEVKQLLLRLPQHQRKHAAILKLWMQLQHDFMRNAAEAISTQMK